MPASKIVITGAAGFVGSYLVTLLRQRFPGATIVPTSNFIPQGSKPDAFTLLDITDQDAVARMLTELQPSHIVHLAAVPTVAGVKGDLDGSWRINVMATLNLADAILTHAPQCALIFAGSAEVYGASARTKECLDEDTLLAPTSEYAASKAAADLALGAFAWRGLKVVRFRPFNHTGPRQSPAFVVPAFAEQIALIEAGRQQPVMMVGNLDAERDFLDVRDVVDAYALAVQHSDDLPSGAIINLASGQPRRIGDILDHLLSLSSSRIEVRKDPARQRPNELRRYFGDPSRARELLGWSPQHSFDVTMGDVLAFWRSVRSVPSAAEA